MLINSRRFGEIEINDQKIITFPLGMPGLEETKKFVLLQNDESKPINWLQAIDNPVISLPVIDPFELFPDYTFDISDDDINELSITDTEDLHVVNVMVIPDQIENMTVNLAAPVLINIKLYLGKQIIIDGRDCPLRQPVFEVLKSKLEEVHENAGAVTQGE